MAHIARFAYAMLTFPFFLLVGCGFNASAPASANIAHSTVGKVFGGQQPVSDSLISVWQVGAVDYGSLATKLASTTSGSDGSFQFAADAYTCPTDTTQVYITAQGGNSGGGTNGFITLVAGLGNCAAAKRATVEINEVSTVVAAFALQQFFTDALAPGALDGLGLGVVDGFGAPLGNMPSLALSNTYTIPTLINVADGTVNPNTPSVTIDSAKIYTLANILAACVNDTNLFLTCNQLFTDTTPTGSLLSPTDTLQAAIVMAHFPYKKVSALYDLIGKQPPFLGLAAAPNDWTIGVSYTTPTMGLGIAGSATSSTSSTIDIDTSGRVWFPSNLAGSTGIGYFDPAAAAFTGPLNATGVTLTQPQYVAIDTSGFAWLTDSASSNIAVFDTTGATAASGGPITGVSSLGPISLDASGDAWVGYTDTGSKPSLGEVVPSAGSTGTFTAIGPYTYNPTGVIWVNTVTDSGAYASTSGSSTACAGEFYDFGGSDTDQVSVTSASPCTSGGAALATAAGDKLSVASTTNQVCSVSESGCTYIASLGIPFNLPQGLATDGYGQEWVADSGNASVSTFSSLALSYAKTSPLYYQHGSSSGSTMVKPYGLAVDGSGNVWVSNAGCVTATSTVCTPGPFVLSEIIGIAGPTITPLSSQNGGLLAGTLPVNILGTNVKSSPQSVSTPTPHSSNTVSVPWLTPRTR